MAYKVAVVIPIYKAFENLTSIEKISLKQCFKILSSHDIFFVTFNGLDVGKYQQLQFPLTKVTTLYFSPDYFNDLQSYSRLLMNIDFYVSFKDYDFMLITQADVFVFSDRLEKFCKLGYDYIGAPWFDGLNKAKADSEIIGVGNGGFSLRNVNAFTKVLGIINMLQPRYQTATGLKNIFRHPVLFIKLLKHELLAKKNNYVSIVPSRFPYFEDIFWGKYVHQFFPWFRVGSINDAMSFAFEVNPKVLFRLNGNQLPMGVHAWDKYDIDFWKPFIEREGYQFDDRSLFEAGNE